MLTKEEMMDLFRDVLAALDVGKKAELGYFDVEFDTFGCTYYSEQERNYRMSSSAIKIYDFIEYAALDNLYPSAIYTENFRKPIPRGMQEMLELESKRSLAQVMQSELPAQFFENFLPFANEMQQNVAYPLLSNFLEQLKCSFDRDQFDLFENTLALSVTHKKLSIKDHDILLYQLNEERKSISTDLRPHDIFNQRFHAFAYELNNQIHYFYDARKELVYAKRYALASQGLFITPILSKTVFYNYEYRLADARKDFAKSLPFIFNDSYFELIKNIQKAPAKCKLEDFELISKSFINQFGTVIDKTFSMYKTFWDIR